MTFYEAALQVLEGAGHPLHFQEITERSIAESLLSHVGKTPEQTMLSRLAAMAKRKGDRRVIVTAKDTFALAEWQVTEDPEALAQTGVVEPHPEEALPPLRPVERHPETRREYVRTAGRGTDRKRRRDEDEDRSGGKRKRYPPVPEVAFDLLSEAHASMSPEAMLEQARELGYASKELSIEALLTALLEDNQKRIDAGRRPQFVYGADGFVSLERAGTPSEAPSLELQAAFAAALGIPLEGGRPVLTKPAPAADAKGEELKAEEGPLVAARTALKEARKLVARAFRQKLQGLEAGTFERATFKLLHGHDFRELKVAKRSKDGPLITARRREGSVELRFAIRLHRGNAVDRRLVQELRRDLGHYNAQVGLVLSAGDLRGDARGEAQASGALVMLWCGDALAEKFLESHTGVKVQLLEVYEPDEAFFAQMGVEAEEARVRREDRQKEREGRGGDRPAREDRSSEGGASEAQGASKADEGDEDLDAATAFVAGTAAAAEGEETSEDGDERRRRRRRRRGRRGRGPKEEGEGEAQSAANGEASGDEAEAADSGEGDDAGVAAASDEAAAAGTADATDEQGALAPPATSDAQAASGESAEVEVVAASLGTTAATEAPAAEDDEISAVSDEDIEEVTDLVAHAPIPAAVVARDEASGSETSESSAGSGGDGSKDA